MRFAPRIKAQQWEALEFRNQMIILEKRLTQITPNEYGFENGYQIFKYLSSEGCGWLIGFEKGNVHTFEKHFSALTQLEKKIPASLYRVHCKRTPPGKNGCPGS